MIATRTFALTLALLACPAFAEPATPAPAPAIAVQTLKDVTRTLSSDAFEGRKPTTPAEAKATDYIVERFKAAGLKRPIHLGSSTAQSGAR